MSLYGLLLRSLLRRHSTTAPAAITISHRTFAFSSAEEAAAERRRRKRRLRIEPPLHALRRDAPPPSQRPPNSPRLPDSTSALVGPRLNLHNRVQSLIRASDLDSASAVARRAVFSSTRPTVFTCNAVIAAMFRAGRYSDAESLFKYFFEQSNLVPNVVSYNNLINSLCDSSRVDDALAVYRRILSDAPFSPSPVTYRHLTKGLIEAGRIAEALDLLREMLNKGHGADSLVYNNLIAGFLQLGDFNKANELFDELKERCLVYDGAVNATFMDWFFARGMEKEAMASYKSLLDRQFKMVPATCNVLLECLIRNGKMDQAWVLFDHMLDNHTPPNFQSVNSETFNIVVNECFRVGMVEQATKAFRKVGTKANSKPFSMDVAGYNNIIKRYCEAGMLAEAEAMFEELCGKSLSPDVNSHRTLIDAYLNARRVDDALRTLTRMVEAGLWLVASYGVKVLDEMVRSGKAVHCVPILRKLGEKDPKPDVSLYEVVVKGLCSEGSLDACRDLAEEMMRHGISVGTELQWVLREAFGGAERGEEIDKVLMRNRLGNGQSPSNATHRRNQPSGPSQYSFVAPPQRNGFQPTPSPNPSLPLPPSRPPQMAERYQTASVGTPHNGGFSASHHYQMPESLPSAQPSWNNQGVGFENYPPGQAQVAAQYHNQMPHSQPGQPQVPAQYHNQMSHSQPGQPQVPAQYHNQMLHSQPGQPQVPAQYQNQMQHSQPGQPQVTAQYHNQMPHSQPGQPQVPAQYQNQVPQSQPGQPQVTAQYHNPMPHSQPGQAQVPAQYQNQMPHSQPEQPQVQFQYQNQMPHSQAAAHWQNPQTASSGSQHQTWDGSDYPASAAHWQR